MAQADRPAALTPLTAGALVFFTSGAVLVLEILAGRLLAPYVGVTLETYTGIIGTVLAGIALGTWLGGRAADALPPRRLLGPLLVWGGALALISVPAISWFGEMALGTGPDTIVMLSLVGFFAPAAVLSAVAPTVVKLQLADLRETGSVVGRLSALGTAGAIVGTFGTGFVLIAAFPSRPLVVAVGLAVVGVGLLLWLRLGLRSDLSAVGLALVLAGGGAAATILLPGSCQWESAYYCVRIEADPGRLSGRTLWLDQLRHSYVDLEDPSHLEFEYTRLFADAIETVAPSGQPVDVLHVGGGGFSLPRYLREARPGTQSTVLELDPLLVDLAQRELGLEPGADLRIETGDGRLTLARQPADAYDVVLGDAFGGLAVPWHLTTREFLADVRRVLRPSGLYVLNLIDYPPLDFARAELATLRDVFANVAFISTPSARGGWEGGTFVMLASDGTIDAGALAAVIADRGWGESVVAVTDATDNFVAGAPVLRDDYAPVDQLISQPPF
ncbi:MAG TPA: fused MFS/spermidine synthase [Candidatus Limnocylindria bacterium]|nr:fused MFS/spermidine synthase [Candidatus Limnocylindria bacterium]